jgi:hypothetical protein
MKKVSLLVSVLVVIAVVVFIKMKKVKALFSECDGETIGI